MSTNPSLVELCRLAAAFWKRGLLQGRPSRVHWSQWKTQTRVCVGRMSRLGGLRWSRLWLSGGRGRSLEHWFFRLGHSTLWSHPGGQGGVSGPGGGQEGDLCRSSAINRHLLLLLQLLLLLRWVPLLRVVLFEADVPGQAADSRHRLKLVDDVPRDEVDVIVAELQADVANAFSPQLVQLGVVHPLDTLGNDTLACITLHQGVILLEFKFSNRVMDYTLN